MESAVDVVIDHSILGRIRGLVSEGKDKSKIIQYHGIKYASIPGRWKDPVLLSGQLTSSEFDATKPGPCCPQGAGGFEFDISLVGNVQLANNTPTAQSELDCLNLVITVPKRDDKSKLPVLVWVHGGGFSVGSCSWPQYDLGNIVSLSAKIGKPVIGVSFNYRLGIFGFLASDELGLHGNYGLKDQACAFKWIKQNISGFGGDPESITAFGESAGAISLSTLLIANENLFNRCILMSGESTLRRIRNQGWQNAHYLQTIGLLGLGNLSLEERRQKMLSMKAEDIVGKLPTFQHWSPTVDGQYLTQEVDLGILSDPSNPIGKPAWCTEILIGDSADDGTILKQRLLDDPRAKERLSHATDLLFSQREKESLLRAYGLTDQNLSGLLPLASDLRFYLPVLKVAEGLQNRSTIKSYRYHFHQLNPVDGLYKGLASHELDVAYLLQNFREHLPPGSIKLGIQMGEIWIGFAYGDGIGGKQHRDELLVIGPEDKITYIKESEYDRRYRNGRGKLLESFGWGRWFKLGEMLQGCYSDDSDSSFKNPDTVSRL